MSEQVKKPKTRTSGMSAEVTPRVQPEAKKSKEPTKPMLRITSIVGSEVLDALSNLTLFMRTSNCRTIAVILEHWCQTNGLLPVSDTISEAYCQLVDAANQSKAGLAGKLVVNQPEKPKPPAKTINPPEAVATPKKKSPPPPPKVKS